MHDLPADLEEMLVADAEARATWEDITPLARNEWIRWVQSVKKVETRRKHVEQARSNLGDGKRRPCCWPGCPHREKTRRAGGVRAKSVADLGERGQPQGMPKAHPPLPLEQPASLTAEEERYILKTIRAYYGDDAVVRNWGPDPRRLMLHVESDRDIGLDRHECLGLLMCEIIRDQISLGATRPSGRWGRAKVAYRQGVILPTHTSD